MESILNLTKTNKLILAAIAFLAVVGLGSGQAHAATITVGSGCTLNDAVDSVNAGSAQASCGGSGYGTNDTINIPAGTQTLTSDVNNISVPVTIAGVGMNQTTISGDMGQYRVLTATTDVTIRDLKITAFSDTAVRLSRNVQLSNIEIDGQDATGTIGIQYSTNTAGTYTVEAENIYIHGINSSSSYVQGFWVEARTDAVVNASLRNVTLADVHNNGGNGVNGIIMVASGDNAALTSTITNTTVDDITSTGLTAPFASYGSMNGGNATINTTVNNITITGTRGIAGTGFTAGLNTAAFYAAGNAYQAGDSVDVAVTVSNSLMADNLSNGSPSNCSFGDMTGNIGGQGTVTTSITSAGYNISDDASCANFNQTGDQQNVINIISTLGPLQNNGGVVPTRALLAGSPAISSGSSVLGVTTDARGIARPNTCPSVGAFQFEGAVCAVTTTNANAGGAAAPNTGAKTASTLMTIIASALGISMITYAFRKRVAVK